MEAFVECQVNPCLVWNFDYESPPPAPFVDKPDFYKMVSILDAETKTVNDNEGSYNHKEQIIMVKKKKKKKRKKTFLKLNYEAVINAWDSRASPWTTGIRPQINPDHFCPSFIGFGHDDHEQAHAGPGGIVINNMDDDRGREAIISRYREKRRTRKLTLSKKKIRYEIRKLNAEKRPRLNGRFIKTI